MMHEVLFTQMTDILRKELVPSTGCTEPTAIAYAAALSAKTLGHMPEKVVVSLSGNLIKNAQSVVVPNTGGMVGIPTAVVGGIVSGNTDAKLDILSKLTAADVLCIKRFLDDIDIKVLHKMTPLSFDIEVTTYCHEASAIVHITNTHQHVCDIYRNGKLVYKNDECEPENATNDDLLTVENIVYYADHVDIAAIRDILTAQKNYNMLLCNEGMVRNYGVMLGQILYASASNENEKATAYTVAGIDARMAGCSLPAIICCGSGNQGITTSMPVVYLGKAANISTEDILRAMIVSDLIAVHIKRGIGCLSAYCGAIVAGAAASAAIAYMNNCSIEVISDTITNALAIASGTVCDGAKASCAAKVQIALDAGFTALDMARRGIRFNAGSGIIKGDVEDTIRAIGRLGKDGMAQTDVEILKIMLDDDTDRLAAG